MARNNGDFAANNCREVMKYLLVKGNSEQDIYGMSVILDDKRPSSCTVNNWVAEFKTGHLSTENKERSGRPTQMTIPENVDVIHSMILQNRRIFIKKIAETLVISLEVVL
jgi:transposase